MCSSLLWQRQMQQEETSLRTLRDSAVQRTAMWSDRDPGAAKSPQCLPSFIEKSRRTEAAACWGWRSGIWGTRRSSALEGGAPTLRRRDGAPSVGPQGRPPPGAPVRAWSLYLHTAEAQQLSHDSSTATPWADMAPGSTARVAPALASRCPGSAGGVGGWRRCSARPCRPGAADQGRACSSAAASARACQRAPHPAPRRRRQVSCWSWKSKPDFRKGRAMLLWSKIVKPLRKIWVGWMKVKLLN